MAPKSIALFGAGGGSGGAAPPPNLTRASLELYEPTPVTGGAKPGAQVDSIPCQFNPKELSISKSAKWERKPAKGSKTAGPPEFTGSKDCGDSITPGSTAFIRMPRGASSSAALLMKPIRPAFAAE